MEAKTGNTRVQFVLYTKMLFSLVKKNWSEFYGIVNNNFKGALSQRVCCLWSELPKYFTKNTFCNTQLLLMKTLGDFSEKEQLTVIIFFK